MDQRKSNVSTSILMWHEDTNDRKKAEMSKSGRREKIAAGILLAKQGEETRT
jgi:hypothetical protein